MYLECFRRDCFVSLGKESGDKKVEECFWNILEEEIYE